MKILLMGDASNYHQALAQALVAAGHDVTLASDGGGWMHTGRDIDLSRGEGKVAGMMLWMRLNAMLMTRMRGYDVVQIASPGFVYLRPRLLRGLFDRLRRNNGIVTLAALGTDSLYAAACTGSNPPLRYDEWQIDGRPTPYAETHAQELKMWLAPALSEYCRYVYDSVDGVLSALYEYHEVCRRFVSPDRLAYAGIPIELPEAVTPIKTDTVNILVACHKGREAEKGIDRILPVVESVVARHSNVRLDLVQNVPLEEFNILLSRAHIVVDQLYSYTPATTALSAMAMGKTVISGAEPEYYDFIGEHIDRPIINADPLNIDALADNLEMLLTQPAILKETGEAGRRFVERHNAADVVARRCIDFWERIM